VNKLKRISAFGFFQDKKTRQHGNEAISLYRLDSARGELHFKSKTRKSSTIFPYPPLIDKLYLNKIPKGNQITVGRNVLVEFQPGKSQKGKIVERLWKDCGKIVERLWKDCGTD